jgi:MtaA/CmuA family methyltransferase
MTGLERVLKTLAGDAADHTPVALHNFLMAAKMLELPFDKYVSSGKLLAKAQIHSWEIFRHDMLMVENGVAAMAQAIGCKVACTSDQPPHVEKPLLESLDDVEDLRIPEPENTFPLYEMLEAVRLIKNHVRNQAFVIGRADQGPMALAFALYGPERLVLDIASGENSVQVHKLLDFCTRCTMRYATSLQKAGADGTCIGGCGLSMSSPAIFREYELPYQQMFVSHCHKNSFLTGVHFCGHEDHILDDMVASGADWLELDPLTSPHAAALASHNRCAILGMIDPVSTLLDSTAKQVQEECSRRLKQMQMSGCRFILGPGCALPPSCPQENIKAMMAVAQSHANPA